MDASVLGRIVDSFVEKVKSNVKRNNDVVSVIKVAMAECNKEVAEAVLGDSRVENELSLKNISDVLQEAIDNYSRQQLDSADVDYALKGCYLGLLLDTLVRSHVPQETIDVPSYVHSTTPLYAMSLAAEMCQSLPIIVWKNFPRDLNTENCIKLMLDAFLIRHPEMQYFLTSAILQNEIDKLLDENVNEQVTSQLKKFNQECSWEQRVHLLLLSSLYIELAVNLEEKYRFNLSAILESRLVDLYVEIKIKEKISLLTEEFSSLYVEPTLEKYQTVEPLLKKMQQENAKHFTFKEQVHLVFADRAILYIYREYLKFNRDKLISQGVYFSEEALPVDDQSYDEWYDIKPLKKRAVDDSIALCKWFKKNRPEVEIWYKTYYADYKMYWSDFFFAEVRNRCFLLGKNLDACRGKRNQLAEMFNDVTEMHYVITPYELFEILDSFKDRVSRKIEQHSREKKEKALADAVNGINRDITRVLSQGIIMDKRLLVSVYEYVREDNNRYMDFLRATLGNNCPRAINDKFQLEKYFLQQALAFNMMGYLFTYAYADKPSLYSKCAWNGVASSSGDNVWGLVRGKLFRDTNAGTSLSLREELNDPENYIINSPDFYITFEGLMINVAMMCGLELEEGQDFIATFFPVPVPVKRHPVTDSIKSALTLYKRVEGAHTPLKGSPAPSIRGSHDSS